MTMCSDYHVLCCGLQPVSEIILLLVHVPHVHVRVPLILPTTDDQTLADLTLSQKGSTGMQMFVNMFTGKTITLEVESNAMIDSMTAKVHFLGHVPAGLLVWSVSQHHRTSSNTIQHQPASSNIIQHQPASSNTIQHHSIIQHHPTPSSIIQHHPASSNTIQRHPTPASIVQHHSTPASIIQHHSTPASIIQHHPTHDVCWDRPLCTGGPEMRGNGRAWQPTCTHIGMRVSHR